LTLDLLDEATASGARVDKACDVLGLSARAVQRWQEQDGGEDQRHGPPWQPKQAFSEQERQTVLHTVNSPEYRNLSPKQIVPTLAEQGEYIASESTIYRILRQEDQLAHHQRSRPAQKRSKPRLVAHGPNEVWTWDITHLQTTVRGVFFYLYLVLDMWSRKYRGLDRRSVRVNGAVVGPR